MKTLKRLAFLLMLAAFVAPVALQSAGCSAEADEEGVDLEVGD